MICAGEEKIRKSFSILLVDDNNDLLKLWKLFLDRTGEYFVDTCVSAKEALGHIESGSYDLIISGYDLPGMDGISFLNIIRNQFGDIPFILFTGHCSEEVLINAINSGVDSYIQKSKDPQLQFPELLKQIHKTRIKKKNMQEIQRREERCCSIINELIELVVRFTPDGTINFYNEAYRQTCYSIFDTDIVLGKNINELLRFQNYVSIDELFNTFTVKNPVRDIELEVIGKDGLKYWYHWTFRAFFDKKENLIEYQGVGWDISKQKEAEITLKKSKEKFNVLSEITRHDILNQVNVIYAICDLMDGMSSPDLPFVQFFEDIRKCNKIIQQSISFTRDYQMLGNSAPLWQNIEKMAKIAAVDNLPDNISLHIQTGGYEIFADPMLMLAFYNLFDNAKKYGEKISRVSLCFEEDHDHGLLIFEDDGVGILPEIKNEIFEKGIGTNSGFGLFLVREILSITGLTIRENGIPGQGARFEIMAPPGMWRKEKAK